jgi:PD-(D/E)XK nuclease superfamily
MSTKKKPFAWSYTALRLFEQCPLSYDYKRRKIPEVEGPALARGIKIHKAAEDYLTGKVKVLSKDLKSLATQFAKLKKLRPVVEGNIGLTRRWVVTGYFDDDVWLRVKLDARLYLPEENELLVIDFKSGRPNPYPDQEALYTAAAFAAEPEVPVVKVQFWYTDHGVTLPHVPSPKRRVLLAQGLQQAFTVRARRMEQTKTFTARPGRHCGYCGWSKKRGGPCVKG